MNELEDNRNELVDVLTRLHNLCFSLHDAFIRKCNELIVLNDYRNKNNDPCLEVIAEYMGGSQNKMMMAEIEANEIHHLLETAIASGKFIKNEQESEEK